jgi:hypothetical protein
MAIQFFASTDQTLDPADKLFFTLSNQQLNLKPLTFRGKPKAFKARLTLPTDLADGSYFLLAEVNATKTISELGGIEG